MAYFGLRKCCAQARGDWCHSRLHVENTGSSGHDKGMAFEGSTHLGRGGRWSLLYHMRRDKS